VGYRELRLRGSPKQQLRIAGCSLSAEFDLDLFGMDDGTEREPGRTFRFLFQLGQGYMIYLYVVALERPEGPLSFETVWLKDCAVAHVEQEELGAPSEVDASLELPVVFGRVTVTSGTGQAEAFAVQQMLFRARSEPSRELEMRLHVRSSDGTPAVLRWSSSAAWSLAVAGASRSLEGAQLAFSEPLEPGD
jgi:hypothetical protein